MDFFEPRHSAAVSWTSQGAERMMLALVRDDIRLAPLLLIAGLAIALGVFAGRCTLQPETDGHADIN